MTAEIAVMNKMAVALAADSAVTVSDKKVYESASKLFMLSKYRPVGIMVYGSAEFMGIPWETVIKMYREQLKSSSFANLYDYSQDFIDYISHSPEFFPDELQLRQLEASTIRFFQEVLAHIDGRLEAFERQHGGMSGQDILNVAESSVADFERSFLEQDWLDGADEKFAAGVVEKYSESIERARKFVFEEFPFPDSTLRRLKNCVGLLFSRKLVDPQTHSGVVFAGFGDAEFFPSMISFHFDSYLDGVLRYRLHKQGTINHGSSSRIIAFAQSEMVTTFMEGINPEYQVFIESFMSELLEKYSSKMIAQVKGLDPKGVEEELEKLRPVLGGFIKEFIGESRQFRNLEFSSPVLDAVDALPLHDLASMAESLVNLTSFKRRVSTEQETVKGPIDVAVISKGDGFIWIKRKHYFRPELNAHFFQNYFRCGVAQSEAQTEE